MSIDINTLRGLATVLCFVAFLAVVLWAWSDARRKDFEQAAQLPFVDEESPGDKVHFVSAEPEERTEGRGC